MKVLQKLTHKEEEVMKMLWKLERAFVKDILAEYEVDKPHYNTLSTMIRNLEDKGYVAHEAYGNTHRYYPLVKKEEYRKKYMNKVISDYFNNSYKGLVSFFAEEEKISVEDLRDIVAEIEKKK
ncbi:BlaI/MecI/CopY family transcriptional regulator [Sinomicrobium sp.]